MPGPRRRGAHEGLEQCARGPVEEIGRPVCKIPTDRDGAAGCNVRGADKDVPAHARYRRAEPVAESAFGLGMDSTLGVTLDMAINHGAAVVRGSERACIIVDMPFGTYQESPQLAFHNAARIMGETGCSGIKIEGGTEMAETVIFLVERGIPVMGHVGLKPQSVNVAGGFRSQGRDELGAEKILQDAIAIAEAGAFSIVVEAVVEDLATKITQAIPVPTIGIGGSSACDGQILVTPPTRHYTRST